MVQVPVPFPTDPSAQDSIVSSLLDEYPDLTVITAECAQLFAKAAGWPDAQTGQAINDTRLLEEIITYFLAADLAEP